MAFLFNVGQKLSCLKLLTQERAAWTEGLHCVVRHRMHDIDTGTDCYVLHEFYYTDYQPQGELRVVAKAEVEKEYVPYTVSTN